MAVIRRFGGEPIVDEATGTLLYRFPSLQARDMRMHFGFSLITCLFGVALLLAAFVVQ